MKTVKKKDWRWYWLSSLSLLSACASTLSQIPPQQALDLKNNHALRSERSTQLSPLPGNLNQKPVFYSNRPELLTSPGEILDSTGFQEKQALTGQFSVFAHHVVETPPFDFLGFRLGLLIRPADSQTNKSEHKTVTVNLHNAFIYRTQPDAPFISSEPVLVQAQTKTIFSGPGDAMAWARLNQESHFPEKTLLAKTLPATFTFDQEILLADIGVPTFPLGLGIIGDRNGMSAWLDLSSTAPVDMRWVAIKTSQSNASLSDYQKAAQTVAGPPELPATNYDPQGAPPSGVFRFARVAGIVQGTEWEGDYTLSAQEMAHLQQGKLLAWPVATTYLKAWANQNQSAPVIARQRDSAIESHGNYGLTYRLTYRLSNPAEKPLQLDWRWSQPTAVKEEEGGDTLQYDPKAQIVFRGSIRIEERCHETSEIKSYHLQIQQGHWHAPFHSQTLPPGAQCQLIFEWVYPPDAIPPQVLSVEKKP